MENSYKTQIQTLTVDESCVGQRVDNFLFTRFKGVPKSKIYNVIRKGEVRVNKKRVKPLYKLCIGDLLRIPPFVVGHSIKSQPQLQSIEKLEKNVIYEDQDFLVLDKPYGMASHGGSGVNFGVIETLRASNIKRHYLELVHRLDRDTSGCLILAKKRSTLKYFHELLRNKEIIKKYLTLVKGKWQKECVVELPLLKNQVASGERIVRINASGKEALSIFRPLKFFTEATLVEVELKTGRTHQIRVHAASKGHPIAGDEKYGDRDFNVYAKKQGLKRMFLHAYSLDFCLANGKRFEVVSQLPKELQSVMANLK